MNESTTNPVVLSADQQHAFAEITAFIRSDKTAARLSGAAGTGKSFLVNQIGHWLVDNDVPFLKVAPTHKALSVLAGGGMTVASMLGLKPKKDFTTGVQKFVPDGRSKVPWGSFIIVDEASMIGKDILVMLMNEVKNKHSKVLFVGDSYQLAPIEDEKRKTANPLALSPVFRATLDGPSLELRQIQRQAADNPILRVAHQYRAYLDGEDIDADVLNTLPVYDSAELVRRMACAALEGAEAGDPNYLRLVAFTNDAVHHANAYVRNRVLHPDVAERWLEGEYVVVNEAVEAGGELVLMTDEMVEVVSSSPESLHGLRGHRVQVRRLVGDGAGNVESIFVPDDPRKKKALLDQLAAEAKALPKDQRGRVWARYFGVKADLVDLRYAHANTVHKAQGSTYQYCVVNVKDIEKHIGLIGSPAAARLFYVALTRAAREAWLNAPLPVLKPWRAVA